MHTSKTREIVLETQTYSASLMLCGHPSILLTKLPIPSRFASIAKFFGSLLSVYK